MSDKKELNTNIVCVVKKVYYVFVEGVPVPINENKAKQITQGEEISEISEYDFGKYLKQTKPSPKFVPLKYNDER